MTPFEGAYSVGRFCQERRCRWSSRWSPAALAALVVARLRRHLALALGLSGVGFSLAVAYALLGAPDVALVAVLDRDAVHAAVRRPCSPCCPAGCCGARPPGRPRLPPVPRPDRRRRLGRRWSCWWCGRPVAADPGRHHRRAAAGAAGQAHGKDVVTVILADFRGLDTMVEITVVVVALLGVAALLRRGRLW